MPRHADTLARGGTGETVGEGAGIFTLSFPEVGETRHEESRASRIFCGTLSGTRSSHGYTVPSSNQRKGECKFYSCRKEYLFVAYHCFCDAPGSMHNAGVMFERQ